jgi:hypothetical protein
VWVIAQIAGNAACGRSGAGKGNAKEGGWGRSRKATRASEETETYQKLRPTARISPRAAKVLDATFRRANSARSLINALHLEGEVVEYLKVTKPARLARGVKVHLVLQRL